MILGRAFALVTLAIPALAQYGGPAILSRGDAPSGMVESQLSFRPYFEISAVYDTGLAGVAVNSKGELGNTSSVGVNLAGGISGTHSWRHTQIGLDYRGDITEFAKATYFDSTNQSLLISLRHQFTRHVYVNFRETAGEYSTELASASLSQAVSYDPSQSSLPTTDFFDNRTIYLSSQADLVYQRSARLSFSIGGSGFLNRRRSTALYGVSGASASGDMQYRVTRRSTIGANYTYSNFSYTRIYSDTDIHAFSGTYAMQLTKNLEFSAYGGVSRVETKLEQVIPVDPAIAALLGITEGLSIAHVIEYIPTGTGRISRKFHNGVLYFSGGRMINSGNGLFLTSANITGSAGYSYTGLRRWSFGSSITYNRSSTIGSVGSYGNTGGTLTASRQLVKSFHIVASVTANRYESAEYPQYNRSIYYARVGFGWTPGAVPLRVW